MVVTTGRADYGLLYPLMVKIKQSSKLALKLIVSGSHLSKQHGETQNVINAGDLDIDHVVPMLCEADSEHAVCHAIAEGLNGFSSLYEIERPGLVVVLGDRYELLSVSIAALIHKIPIAHIHGGEATFGIIDEAIRHSVTKMSTLHFPSIERYKQRIVQLGEAPERVHVVGSLGIDNIKNMNLLDRDELSRKFEIDFTKKLALVTYHPVTLDAYQSSMLKMQTLLDVLVENNILSLITMPNADPGNKPIYDVIKDYEARYPDNIKFIKNLGQLGYLSAMKYASLMVGNSSSGIIESASFRLPVINVGDRQNGRYKPLNIIDVECEGLAIQSAIEKSLSVEFTDSLNDLVNPYGGGEAAEKIMTVLECIDYGQLQGWIKKEFYDFQKTMLQVSQ